MVAFRVLGLLAGVLTSVVLARLLGTADMGVYFLAISIVKSLTVVGQFGLGNIGVRRISDALVNGGVPEAQRIGKTVINAGSVSAVLVAVTLYLLIPAVPVNSLDGSGLDQIRTPVALWLFSSIIIALVGQTFQGFHDLRRASLFSAATGSLLSALIYAALLVFEVPITLSIVAWIAVTCSAVTMVAAIVGLQSGFGLVFGPVPVYGNSKKPVWHQIMSDALPFWITSVALLVMSELDVWVIAHFLTMSEVAVYGAALRLILLSAVLTEIVATVLQATVSELHSRNELERVGRVLRAGGLVVGIAGTGLLVLYVLFPEFVITYVFGDAYRSGANILVIHAVGILIGMPLGLPGVALRMMDGERTAMRVTLATAAFAGVAVLLGVRWYGSVGVAYAVAISVLLQKVILWKFAKSILGVRTDLFALRRQDIVAVLSLFQSVMRGRFDVLR